MLCGCTINLHEKKCVRCCYLFACVSIEILRKVKHVFLDSLVALRGPNIHFPLIVSSLTFIAVAMVTSSCQPRQRFNIPIASRQVRLSSQHALKCLAGSSDWVTADSGTSAALADVAGFDWQV